MPLSLSQSQVDRESLTTAGQTLLRADQQEDQGPDTGFIAQRELLEQRAAYRALMAVAVLREEARSFFQDVVARVALPLSSATNAGRATVAVTPNAWAFEDSLRVSEIALHGAPSGAGCEGEEVFIQLLYGLAHVYNHWASVKDVSNRERYHYAHFAHTLRRLGIDVDRDDGRFGLVAGLRIADTFAALDASIVADLDRALVLSTPTEVVDPLSSTVAVVGETGATKSRYLFASCRCLRNRRAPRTIRIAVESWQASSILCALYSTPFVAPRDPGLVATAVVPSTPSITHRKDAS